MLLNRTSRRSFAALLRSQRRLSEALQRAESADRAKSEFLASISHEIRTPLNSVLGALHLLKAEPLSADAAMLVGNALASGRMVTALINDVLDYSKIVAGEMALHPAPASLPAILDQVRSAFAPECARKGLTFTLSASPDVAGAEIDELRLRQCLFNLVGNAVKFTDTGGVALSAIRTGEVVSFEVKDTGPGIAPEVAPHLFQRFRQADGSTTRRFGGTGLGLAISRHLAEAMGGGIALESTPGEGATFTLTVRAPAVEVSAAPPVEAVSRPLEEILVLLVDDNVANLAIGSRLLEQFGARVVTADSGAAALAQAQAQAFDLIVMDIQMPEPDGVETTRRLRAEPGPSQQSPVIALTANVLESQRRSYAEAGMDGVAGKPIEPRQLLTEIVRVLMRARPC